MSNDPIEPLDDTTRDADTDDADLTPESVDPADQLDDDQMPPNDD